MENAVRTPQVRGRMGLIIGVDKNRRTISTKPLICMQIHLRFHFIA